MDRDARTPRLEHAQDGSARGLEDASTPRGTEPARDTPYLDALRAYAARDPGRFHVPGHKGGAAAEPSFAEALSEGALALDIPTLTRGVDVGVEPTPFHLAQRVAAEVWGARRTWFLINGASQGNHVASLALAHAEGGEVVVQRNIHSSTIDGLVLSGLRPTFVQPELDPELQLAHCLTPDALAEALDRTPGAAGAMVVSPTYFGAAADVAGLARVAHERGVPLVVDEAWGAHFTFHDALPQPALSAGADLVVSSTHKIIGSLTQSAMLHLGEASEGRLDEQVVDRTVTLVESTSPSSLLLASLDAARMNAAASGREMLTETIAALRDAHETVRALPGLDVLDERLAGRRSVASWDPLRLAIDVRGTGRTGYEIGERLFDRFDVNLELVGENVIVAVFGMAERASARVDRLVTALRGVLDDLDTEPPSERPPFAEPPPWGPLAMSPREAFLGPQEVVPIRAAAGRVAAESLAAYPPGVPNVLPGERLTAETLEYVLATLEHGGTLRGASDRRLETIRVAVER
jgi:arginine/lysine/ornithine decarboxylase